MAKWTMDKIVGRAYGELVAENKALKKQLSRLKSDSFRDFLKTRLRMRHPDKPEPEAQEGDVAVTAMGTTLEEAFEDLRQKLGVGEAGDPARRFNENIAEGLVDKPLDQTALLTINAQQAAKLGAAMAELAETKAINNGLRNDLAGQVRETNDLRAQLEVLRGNNQLDTNSARGLAEGAGEVYQNAVAGEIVRLWGPEAMQYIKERTLRFLEEAIELAQATQTVELHDVAEVAKHVFNKEIGKPVQEAGGVLVTLAGLCKILGFNMWRAGVTELDRLKTKTPEEMRERHMRKPVAIRDVSTYGK